MPSAGGSTFHGRGVKAVSKLILSDHFCRRRLCTEQAASERDLACGRASRGHPPDGGTVRVIMITVFRGLTVSKGFYSSHNLGLGAGRTLPLVRSLDGVSRATQPVPTADDTARTLSLAS